MQVEGKSYTPTSPRVLRKILIGLYKIIYNVRLVYKLVYKSDGTFKTKPRVGVTLLTFCNNVVD